MKKFKLFLIFIMFFILFVTISNSAKANNGVHYKTYTEDSKGRLIPTQDAYIPVSVVNAFGTERLYKPEDIFISHDQSIYIADTGNKRILKIKKNLTDVEVIQIPEFKTPKGIYVTENGDIYVADTEATQVFKLDSYGNLIQSFGIPTEPLFGDALYRPTKVVVDSGGNIYICSEGNYNGAIQLNKYGEFLGYFGANISKASSRQRLIKAIFPEDVVSKIFKIKPVSIYNLAIDTENQIYTITQGDDIQAIRKLNIAGHNMIKSDITTANNFMDIIIGPIGNIYAITRDGFIYEYDRDGNLLFVFGGRDTRYYYKGLFNTPSGIVVDDSFNIYVLDKEKNELHIFVPTEFANLVHEALYYDQEGLYLQSKEPWEKVLKINSMFDLAHKGIGKAYYKEQMMKEALLEFKLIGYKKGYSDAFWEIRNDWLIKNLNFVFMSIIILTFIGTVYRIVYRKKESPLVKLKRVLNKSTFGKQLDLTLDIRKHPIDAFYNIKHSKGISVFTATFLYVLTFIIYVIKLYYTGPVFSDLDKQNFSLTYEFVAFLGPIFLLIIANYLITTIMDGSGKFIHIYNASANCLIPIIILWPVNTLLSHILTLNEAIIYNLINLIAIGWTAVLLFIMIKEIHNYTFKETIKVILLTIFTFIILLTSILLLNNVFGLIYDFFYQIYFEVSARV